MGTICCLDKCGHHWILGLLVIVAERVTSPFQLAQRQMKEYIWDQVTQHNPGIPGTKPTFIMQALEAFVAKTAY